MTRFTLVKSVYASNLGDGLVSRPSLCSSLYLQILLHLVAAFHSDMLLWRVDIAR